MELNPVHLPCVCSYDIPVVKDSVNYADSLIKSYSLPAAVYRNAEALATTIYKKAGEPIQDRLQPQVSLSMCPRRLR